MLINPLLSPAYLAFANCLSISTVCSGSSIHFASVPGPSPVLTVSAYSSSFSLRNSRSSLPMASRKSRPSAFSESASSENDAPSLSIPNQSARGPLAIGARVAPPGARIAPTAVDRETLFGRTRKEFAPGMMRRPYFSPRLRVSQLINIMERRRSRTYRRYGSELLPPGDVPIGGPPRCQSDRSRSATQWMLLVPRQNYLACVRRTA